jgi:hypothetical protein
MDRLKQFFGASPNYGYGYGYTNTLTEGSSGFGKVGVFIFGAILALLFIWGLNAFVLSKAETRPIKQGFYGGPINGTSSFACSRMSSEAEELVSMFSSRPLNVGEEGQMDLHDLKAVLSKMLCMKRDLMSPQHTITAVKELGFATHMDIQPVADLTARCFTKTVPDRDLDIQYEKWRDFGLKMVKRLCTAGNFSEAEVQHAEKLLLAAWKDSYDVASVQCLKTITDEKISPRDVAPHTPEDIKDLREYDGYY